MSLRKANSYLSFIGKYSKSPKRESKDTRLVLGKSTTDYKHTKFSKDFAKINRNTGFEKITTEIPSIHNLINKNRSIERKEVKLASIYSKNSATYKNTLDYVNFDKKLPISFVHSENKRTNNIVCVGSGNKILPTSKPLVMTK